MRDRRSAKYFSEIRRTARRCSSTRRCCGNATPLQKQTPPTAGASRPGRRTSTRASGTEGFWAKTQFGWHVIKLEDRRTAAPAPLEEIEAQLREGAARDILEKVFNGLRDGAEIEVVSESGERTGAAAPEPAPAQ